ncbi:T9SS type A sorting domain-containing protein [Fibrella aquatica]|uniref:T9SS type A sorting domain-containing protein n=1 Tax=Fibrella aquatica TaxID=3242487 RepID=UPI003520A0D2
MMHHYALRLLVVLLLTTGSLMAQKRTSTARTRPLTTYENFAMRNRLVKADSIICYASKENAFTRIGPPQGFGDSRARRAATSTFIVDYVGYPDSARAAFQRAVDIWSTLIVSPVPIRIRATWQSLPTGALGSARPATYIGAPDGSQRATAYYPIALAEKISRRPLNNPANPDIVANFSSDASWYTKLDGQPTGGRYDLVTVVLHELGHGLGFSGGITENQNEEPEVALPVVFDTYIENNLGTKILSEQVANSPAALLTQATGQNLFINGPILRSKTGDKAKIYAPATYDAGSSLYHLDENTYRQGTPNSLMTPFIGAAEVSQNPGPVVLSFFEDMEWKTTSLLHEPISDLESAAGVTFTARVISDTTLGAEPPKLFYRTGFPTTADNTYKEVNLVRQGTSDTYSVVLPATETPGRTVYYLQTRDASGRTFTNPGKDNAGTLQYYYSFLVGPDRVPPTIVHAPEKSVLLEAEVDTLAILAKVTDDRRILNAARTKQGIDTVFVEYRVDGVARPAVSMFQLDPSVFNVPDSTWVAGIPIAVGSLRGGSVISYRIGARDLSSTGNLVYSPATGFYSITVVAPQTTVRNQYINDFNAATAAADFTGNGFRIEQPTSFSSASINSDHPYKNGADVFNESNYTYTLLAPIRVKENPDSARIQFDEIALIEPSDPGSVFGEAGFYDYVIVEGSKDGGRTWRPMLDGYNINDKTDWTTAWNSSTASGLPNETNSTAVGRPALVKPRTIFIQATGFFVPNDVVLIRFRLFADQLVHGWGWQIDNLKVQVAPPPPILATEPLPIPLFAVYPNPATGTVRVTAELAQTATEGTMTLSGPTGQTLRQLPVAVRNGKQISEQLDVSQLPAGIYFLQLNAGDAKQVKKIMVTR